MTDAPATSPARSGRFERLDRGDPGFTAAVRDALFNTLEPADEPDAVVCPQTEADLVAIVDAAREGGHRLAVRSGGHSWVAASARDSGVLVDLSAFDRVHIDTGAMLATVGPAVRGGELGTALVAHDVAFPVGHCGTPGVGGFLLAGGLGVNWGHWLPSCFSIRSMRVVLASGEIVTASKQSNPDLFWLARGSGPGFPGIVTEFELELKALPRDVRLSSWEFDLGDAGVVSEWVSRASAGLPSTVEVSVMLAGPERPGGPGAAGAHGGPTATPAEHVISVVAISYTDTEAEADEAFAALEGGPGIPPLAHTDRVSVAFDALHEGVDATYPEGHRYLADTFWLPQPLGEVLPQLTDVLRRAPSGKSYVLSAMPGHGGGKTLLPEGEAAYGMHDVSMIVVYTIWRDAEHDDANRRWLDEVAAILEPQSSGHVLSEADLRHAPGRAERSFRPEDWRRILELTERFDGGGVFHRFPA